MNKGPQWERVTGYVAVINIYKRMQLESNVTSV